MVAGTDSEAGGVPATDRGGVGPRSDGASSLTSFTRGDGALAAAGCGSAANAAASRAGDSGMGLGALEAVTAGGGGGVVSILLREPVEPSLETDPAMDAVSESWGGGVAEVPRLGKPGMLNAVDDRRIAPPTRARKVDFLWGVGGDAIVKEGVRG